MSHVLVVLAAVVLPASIGHADTAQVPPGQPPPDAESSTEPTLGETQSVFITSRPDWRDSFDQPAAVAVVDAEQAGRQAPAVLPDLLRDQPGVFVQQTGPGQGAPVVRGLIGSAVLMLVDGVRLNNAFFRPAPNQFFALVDAYNIERVEIVRGPGSSPYGSDAMGGVVRVFTPTPRFSGPDWQVRARALGQVASADRSVVSRLSLAGGKEGFSATSGVTLQQRGDLRAGGGLGAQSPTAFSAYAANAKLAIDRGRHHAVLGAQYLIEPETPRYDELIPGFGRMEAPNDLFMYEPMSRLVVHGHHRYSSSLAAARSLETRLSFQRMEDGRRVRDRGAAIETRENNRADSIGLALEAVAALGTQSTLSYGVDFNHERVTSDRFDRDLVMGTGQPGTARYPDGSRMFSAGLFAQNQWVVHPRVTLVPGARFSVFDLDIPAADRDQPAQLRLMDFSGGLGTLVRLSQSVNLVANLGRGFRAPNVFDLSTLGNRPGNRFQVPNPDLRPESILGADGGVKLAFARVTGELLGFFARYRDKIEAAPTGMTDAQGRIVVRSENVARVDLMGVEAGLRVYLPAQLQLSTGLNYTHGLERSGSGEEQPADRIPPLNLRAGLLWQPGERFWAEGFVRAAGRQDRLSARDLTDPRIDPAGTPGWSTLNLRVGGTLGRGRSGGWLSNGTLGWKVALENLLNVRYRDHGSGLYAPGASAIVGLEGQI
jgi:outer membrane receptor protein involved in Fe transport